MPGNSIERPAGWFNKFRVAHRGLFFAVANQNSFWVHLPVAIIVIGLATWLNVERWQWALLTLSIGGVISSELLNTSIELLVRVVHPEHDDRVGEALDTAAAAVLVMAYASIALGLVALLPELVDTLG